MLCRAENISSIPTIHLSTDQLVGLKPCLCYDANSVEDRLFSVQLMLSLFCLLVTGNMVRGLDEDETSFLDEVSRQQVLVEKQRRDEEKKELLEYRISFFMGSFLVGAVEFPELL